MLNCVFVCFTYGIGLPLLFPFCCLAIFSLYVVEKTMIYWSYRQPPTYDDKLNKAVLAKLTWAPVIFICFGYWMLSNKQLYGNEIYPYTYSSDVETIGHVWWHVFTDGSLWGASPALPFLLFSWVFLIFTFFRVSISAWLTNKFPEQLKVGDIELDEDLPNYFETLDDQDRNWSICEEKCSRDEMGMNILTDHTYNRFKSTKQGNSHLEGIHTYDILANILYVDDFQYFSSSLEDRSLYIIDDDDDEDNDNA